MINEKNVKCLTGIVHQEAIEATEKAVKARAIAAEKRQSAKEASAANNKGGAGAAHGKGGKGSGAGKGRGKGGKAKDPEKKQFTKKDPLHGENYTVKDCMPFLPPNPDCAIRRDGTKYLRWQVYYPNEEGNRYAQLAWNDWVTERECILFCLRWLWDCYTAQNHGAVCPFDFSE